MTATATRLRDRAAEDARRDELARDLGFATRERMRDAIRRGEFPPAAGRRPKPSVELDAYLAALTSSGYAAATVRGYRKTLARIERDLGKPLVRARHRDLRAWARAVGRRVDPTAVAAYRHVLAGFYRWAHASGHMAADQVPLVLLPGASPISAAWSAAIAERVIALRAAGRAETTIRRHRGAMTLFARHLDGVGPWEVGPDDVTGWLGLPGLAREYRRGNLNIVRGFYRWALGTGRNQSDPTQALESIRSSFPKPHPTPVDVYLRALDGAEPREHLMLRLAAEAGLRRGEVAAVHRDDLSRDLVGWTLLVHGKGERDRLVPLTDDLADELLARGTGFAFPGNERGHLSPHWVGRLVARRLPAGATMHGLRHSFATNAYAVDRDVFTVQALLGHSSPVTTMRYVELPDDTRRRTVEAVAAMTRRPSGT